MVPTQSFKETNDAETCGICQPFFSLDRLCLIHVRTIELLSYELCFTNKTLFDHLCRGQLLDVYGDTPPAILFSGSAAGQVSQRSRRTHSFLSSHHRSIGRTSNTPALLHIQRHMSHTCTLDTHAVPQSKQQFK